MSDIPIFFQGTCQLAGWVENHNQGCRVTFWLESPEALEPFRMATVRKGKIAGQIFQMVLVEVDPDDGEKPMRHPSNDAHLLLTGADFVAYSKAHCTVAGARDHWDGAMARAWAKRLIGCESLSQLDSDPAMLVRYTELVLRPFQQWNGTGGDDGNDDLRDGYRVDESE